ncbi:MAG: methyltransferase domain-containing protein [candidate division Zixibacteria bacterium]|nr:methyltransferase domain-containing protein [candidate division Zixibacteria bacterium]
MVDLGGGEGYFAALFATARRKIVVDAVAAALAVAKRRGLAAVQGDVRRLPFKDASCDLILSSDVLEHLPPGDLGVALREAARVMTPGGTALVNTSCYGLYFRRWLRRAPGPGRLDLDDLEDGHLSRPKRAELEAAFAAAGLKIKKRCYYKHLFQPITTLLVRLTQGGRGDEARAAKEKTLASGPWRALNAARIFVAGLDALFFGWLPGGAVVYKLEK